MATTWRATMSEYYPLCPICGFELFAQAEKERGNAASALASMTEQRDAARKDAQEAVAAHGKLMEYYVADFSRLMSNNKELRELRQTCSDLGAENEALSQELAKEERVCKEIQRDLDYRNNVHEELRRQFDVAVNDRNILRARCDE
ncbi:MAG TPA: hypothetical protein PK478_13510, partial [Nitrospira sp.]|nr:hypothetical protein [Nitrospira sp.]